MFPADDGETGCRLPVEEISMTIAVASGKGGTGKTTFAVNLAYALVRKNHSVRLLDCDVEEPNGHLFVKPRYTEEKPVAVLKPRWDQRRCIACGQCARACHYNAIAVVKKKLLIFNELCHACGVCSCVCAQKALHEEKVVIGRVRVAADHKPFFFADGLLNIGETLAPIVVEAVKKQIMAGAINILDASPGTACPVVRAVQHADVAVLVTEPTPFGLNDLSLAAAMTVSLGVSTGIVVNRSDGQDRLITRYSEETGMPIIGRIPFRREYAETYARGKILIEHHKELAADLLKIFEEIKLLRKRKLPEMPRIEELPSKKRKKFSFVPGKAKGYREISVISGKGGTGKTTLVASLSALSRETVLADNDVDAPDLHLLLQPEVLERHPFSGSRKAIIDAAKCAGCGRCAQQCHFGAIGLDGPANEVVAKTYRVKASFCEGCGLCSLVCPVGAISLEEEVSGNWFVSDTAHGLMVHARLGIAQENSGRLVTQVRHRAARLAEELSLGRILGDGPPGTGCPVIASVSGADLVLVVTEPTVSGIHDLKRILELTKHFRVPALVVINKADLNRRQLEEIKTLAGQMNSPVLGSIPFDLEVNQALQAGRIVVEYGDGAAARAIREIWAKLNHLLEERREHENCRDGNREKS